MDDEEALLYGDGDVGDNAGQAENEQFKEKVVEIKNSTFLKPNWQK